MGDGGNLKRMFGDLGLDKELKIKVPATYFEACLPTECFVLGNSHAAVERTLIERFPGEEAAIKAFFHEVNVYGRHGYYQFQMMEGKYEADFSELRYAHRHLKNISVSEALSRRFEDSVLQEILAATGIYVGGFAEDLGYLYFLHVVYATLCKGNAYLEGASQSLSDSLVNRIVASGGEVLLGTTVTQILTDEGGGALGVDTTRGRFLAPQIYINAAPHYALANLLPRNQELAAVESRLQALKPSRSTTTVYLTTDIAPAELGLDCCETMIFAASADAARASRRQARENAHDAALSEPAYWVNSPMEVTNYHALNPEAGKVVCLNVLDDITHWPDRRDLDYKAKKERAVNTLLDRLYAAKPAFSGHVTFRELASPRTYQRFTNNTDGAGYGAMVGTDLSGHLFHRQFPIAGVHFLSAWVAGPSYEAAFGYAEMKAKQWVS
jgi:phytoene dehydrogenase-like protein